MTATNLEVVRSIVGEWSRGDYSSAAWADPEIEFVMADGPSPGAFEGIEQMAAVWRDYMTTWEDVSAEAEDYRELSGDRVLVLIDFRGRGRLSGLEVDEVHARGANLFELREGKVTRLVLYFDRANALADLGLA